MRLYELVIILPLDDEKQKLGREKVLADLSAIGAAVEKTDELGDRDLAYEINGMRRAKYVLFTVKIDPSKVAAADKAFKLNANLVRYLFVRKEVKEAS
jgi:small subunit ribosomal protein S6